MPASTDRRPLHLIITVDYELFGDGSGGVEPCVIRPTERLLRIAERHGAPVTLFVEAAEFEVQRAAAAADPRLAAAVTAMERQIAEACAGGHDAQLHVHPQWERARRTGEGDWKLDFGAWRIGDLESSRARGLLDRGRELVQEIARRGRPGHVCDVFRAGAWCIQPGRELLPALAAAGFRVDSSVAPGMVLLGTADWYDFRDAPQRRAWWRFEDDVLRATDAGKLIEVPIATGRVPAWRRLARIGASRLAPQRFRPRGCRGSYRGPAGALETARGKLDKLRSAGRAMLDLSTLDAAMLAAILDQARTLGATATPAPVVAIAHTKNFGRAAERELDRFLAGCVARGDVAFATFGSWLEASAP